MVVREQCGVWRNDPATWECSVACVRYSCMGKVKGCVCGVVSVWECVEG